jgi:hypothetical protein
LQAFLLTPSKYLFRYAVLIYELPAKPEAGLTALAETQFNQTALSSEHFDRKLSAVFSGHRPLECLQNI